MASGRLLLTVLFLETTTKGFMHVGERCNPIIKICLASNSYCDDNWICRCKPDYPVKVAPHSCKKGRRYGEQCRYAEECQFYDPNTYCHELPYRSLCECFPEFLYSKSKRLCEAIVSESPKSSSIILPTAIGLSLAFAGVLCCCMILWHLCQRQNIGHWSFLSRNTMSTSSSHHQNQIEGQNSFLNPDETLPNYATALTLKTAEEDCDPPPSYEEVVQNSRDFESATCTV